MYFSETPLFHSEGRSNYRIPSIIATNDGTVLAFCNDRRDSVRDHAEETHLVYARKKTGQAWENTVTLNAIDGWCCLIGSAVYDSVTDTAFCTVERRIAIDEFGDISEEEVQRIRTRAAEKAKSQGIEIGEIIYSTGDCGDTWQERPLGTITRKFVTHDGRVLDIAGMCHGSSAGIQLRHGKYAGRLLCPSRIFTNRYSSWDDAILACYNNSIYSDDHGATWHASAPLQQGTGEGTLIELANGDILYNSRNMHRDGTRLTGISTDGGETYHNFSTATFLFEEKRIGCNASFLRVEAADIPGLPDGADSITLFANPRAEDRTNMTICASFDSCKTWSVVKSVWKYGCAYSSLAYDKVSKHFFLLYEKGETAKTPYKHGISLLEFDLEWLMG